MAPGEEWRPPSPRFRTQSPRVAIATAGQEPAPSVRPRLPDRRSSRLPKHRTTARAPPPIRPLPARAIAATPPGPSGSLRFTVLHPDDYDVVVDNREGRRDVKVRVRVALEFGTQGPQITTASPARQLTVVALSFLFFFGVVTYSARRIL